MRYFAFLLLFTPTMVYGDDSLTDLQNSTVIVKTPKGHGSGFLFTRTTETGRKVHLVWTAAHVVEHYMNDDGRFELVKIIQGENLGNAVVLRCGDPVNGIDCALLKVLYGDFPESKLKFYRDFNDIKVGQKIIHCGTPYSSFNQRIITSGTIAYVNRVFKRSLLSEERRCDHCSINAGPGSSGGAICDAKTGGVLGIVVISSGPNLALVEKTASLFQWVQTHNCTWAFDRSEPMPDRVSLWQGDTLRRRMAKKTRIEFKKKWEGNGK